MNQYLNKDEVLAAFEWGDADVCEDFGGAYGFSEFGFSRAAIQEILDQIPAADVVPVVRCKDCCHFKLNMENDPYCSQRDGLSDPTPDSFCSLGERKENANV